MAVERVSRFIREWGGVTAFVVVVGLMVLYFSLGVAATERQHAKVAENIRQELVQHGKAAAARSCSTAKLMSTIITSRTYPPKAFEKKVVRRLVRDACAFVEPIA